MKSTLSTEQGIKVWNRSNKKFGITTGHIRHGSLEGCTGLRLGVTWRKNKITFPCTRGMKKYTNHWRIWSKGLKPVKKNLKNKEERV